MLPVLDLLQKPQIPAVFLIPLVGIPGQCTEDRPEHQSVGKGRQRQADNGKPDNETGDAQHKSRAQKTHIHFVGTVPAGHKIPRPSVDLFAHPAEHIRKTVHGSPPFHRLFYYMVLPKNFQGCGKRIYDLLKLRFLGLSLREAISRAI